MDILKQMFEAYFDCNKRMGYMTDEQIKRIKDIIDVNELEKEINDAGNPTN